MDLSIIIEENGKRDHPSLIAEKIAISKKCKFKLIKLLSYLLSHLHYLLFFKTFIIFEKIINIPYRLQLVIVE